MTASTLVFHGLRLSGHSHRAELLLVLLGLPYRFVEAGAEVRASQEFRRLNPLGQIPVLEDGEHVIADSNAILVYLAGRYDPEGGWLPRDPLAAAQVQRWLSVAAGEVRHGPAQARMMVLFGAAGSRDAAHALSERVLRFMDDHLAGHAFLTADRPTVADLACYSYVAHAPEGGVSLAPYPAVRAWLQRIEALPRFLAMPRSPIPDAA
ncbi:glutathione S-transferase [Methylobacterium trifolii]|uniref:Glutathione S-transferase n=1 Tax=Methylobacterium trifolii TaxID=1003092 RepID=A0ABQ4TW89_9HYPH|nr:glutathione S-transferase [Methylobacterium trifolii]GJE59515.1 hypothetical protein MPOCJGCO_1608 [Methylobacterium trifolii]